MTSGDALGRSPGAVAGAALLAALLATLLAALLAGCDRASAERGRLRAWSEGDRLGGVRIAQRPPTRPPPGAERTLAVVATGDLKGWITSRTLYPRRAPAGLAYLAPVIRSLRRAYPHLVLLDAGDAINGAPEATLFTEGTALPPLHFPVLKAMNALGYDAMALGNFDLALGWASLAHAQAQADFRWLSANLERTRGGTVLPPYLVVERGGVRVAVLGMTTPRAAVGRDPRTMEGRALRDLVATARRWVPVLRGEERADLVIGLFHSGLDEDFRRKTALRSGTALFAGAGQVADAGLGFDLVVSGDAHRLSPRRSRGADSPYAVPVLEPGAYGEALAVAVFRLAERAGRWAVVDLARHTLAAAEAPAADVLARVSGDLDKVRARLAEPTAFRFSGRPRKGVFRRCAAALSHRTAAFLAGEAPRATLSLLPLRWRYAPPRRAEAGGPLRRAHLYRWLRYGERLVQARLTGRQIALLLEGYVRHVRGWRVPSLEVLGPGGMTVEIAEGGASITGLRRAADGRPLEPHATYPVWLTRFIWHGGGGLAPRALVRPEQKVAEVRATLRAGLFALLSDPAFDLPEPCAGWLAPAR